MGNLYSSFAIYTEGGVLMSAIQRRINRITGVSGRGGRRAASRRVQSAMRARASSA